MITLIPPDILDSRKKACKQRAAELKDEQLYCQGHERPEGDFSISVRSALYQFRYR